MRAVLRHLLAAALPGTITVTALYDRDPDAAEALRALGGRDIEIAGSEQALASHPAVDWVFIGSWNALPARQAVKKQGSGLTLLTVSKAGFGEKYFVVAECQ